MKSVIQGLMTGIIVLVGTISAFAHSLPANKMILNLQLRQPTFYVTEAIAITNYKATNCVSGEISASGEHRYDFFDGYKDEVLSQNIPVTLRTDNCEFRLKDITIGFTGRTSKTASFRIVLEDGPEGTPYVQAENLVVPASREKNNERLHLAKDPENSNEIYIGYRPENTFPKGILFIY